MAESAPETFIGLVEVLHLVLVTGAYKHELPLVVFHPGHQPCQRLQTLLIVAMSCLVVIGEGISFVYEQHPSHRFVHGCVHILVRIIDVGGKYIARLPLDHPVRGYQSHCLEKSSESAGYGTLASAGITREQYVHRSECGFPSVLGLYAVHLHVLGKLTHLLLYRIHPNELVQFFHHILHCDLFRAVLSDDVFPRHQHSLGAAFFVREGVAPSSHIAFRFPEQCVYLTCVTEIFCALEIHSVEMARESLFGIGA